jgi:hypothetical protein
VPIGSVGGRSFADWPRLARAASSRAGIAPPVVVLDWVTGSGSAVIGIPCELSQWYGPRPAAAIASRPVRDCQNIEAISLREGYKVKT